MSPPIISVEHLSKRYIIGHQRNRHDGLRHQIEDILRSPWRWFRNRSHPRSSNSHLPSPTKEEFWALKDVSFEVRKGEALGVIGRNGAGKSTLLKILSRITEPTRGRVRLKGRVASLLEVGTGFHPELTGRENIFLNGAILGMSRLEIKIKFDEIVAFSEIENFLDTPVKRYSSGMYVRLAFAVAAHLEPEILIVDEVLAVGDLQFQRKCLGKMGQVAKGGRTVVFVSHNMTAVTQLCERVLLLSEGRVVQTGPAGLLVEKYLRTAAADLSRCWLGPDTKLDDGVSVRAARIYAKGAAGIINSEEITFQCVLDVLKPGHYAGCLALRREGELVCLANTYHLPERLHCKSVGRYSLCFTIPKYLLNPGIHVAGFYLADERAAREHYFHVEELLAFEVEDDNWRRGGVFSGPWPGAVSPIFKIDLQYTDELPAWCSRAVGSSAR